MTRRWAFTDRGFTLHDRVKGSGERRAISRVLVTPLAVNADAGRVTVQGETAAWQVRFDGECALRPLTQWLAYGRGIPATAIEITAQAGLPWEGTITVEAA